MKQHHIRSQQQISFVKEMFSRQLALQLGLMEAQAPILSRSVTAPRTTSPAARACSAGQGENPAGAQPEGSTPGQVEAPDSGSLRFRPG